MPMSSPVGAPKPNFRAHSCRRLRGRRAALVEAVADVVEVRVARGRERLGQVHRAVDVRIPVLEDVLVRPYIGRARALDRGVRREEVLLHRGERRDRLPGRARRVGDLGDAVQTREVRPLRGRVVHERSELLGVDAPDVDRGLVGRVGRHRANGAVARVERDDRAAADVVLLVVLRERDALADRALGGALELDVEREPHRRAGPCVAPDLERPLRAAERVDADLGRARDAAQVPVERRLDAGLADLVAAPVVGLQPLLRLQLRRRDLADVAEHLRGERLVRVVAQVRLLDLHARELGRVLLQVVDLVVVHGRLDGDRRQRVDAPVVDLAREARRRHVEHGGEALDHPVAPCLLRHVADPQLHRRARDVADDHPALAVEDRAARRLDPDRPQLVVLGRLQVALAREHLQRPEPEEEQGEDRERDDAEDRRPARRGPA